MHKAICLLLCVIPIWAQTTSNPDLSVIGQLQVTATDTGVSLNGADLELAITGHLNPYARAEVYLHKHDVESALELEEAVLTIERGLPLGLAARVGRLRPDFGKINREHAHQWPFINAPHAISSFAGPEMWSGTGAELSVLFPVPWYAVISLGTFTNGMSAEAHMHETEHDHSTEESEEHPSFSVRLGHFFELGSVTHLALGSSYYTVPETEAALFAIDSKMKWKPDTYRGFTLQSEFIMNTHNEAVHEAHEEEAHMEVPEFGLYAYADYQFNRKWNIGLMLDGVKHHEEDTEYTPSVFLGFSPVEESSVLRVVFKNNVHEGNSELLMLTQLIWSLGPHKPHTF